MFSGIVETTAQIIRAQTADGVLRVFVERPSEFNDLSIGDSIAVDGVCLTVEAFDSQAIQFALGPETLKVTEWTLDGVKDRVVNLERSLRLGDRIHGHLVTGHVDARAGVLRLEPKGETLTMWIEIPVRLSPLIWPKGSITLNGVSLTVNAVENESLSVGLIPETLKRTNLGRLKVGDRINLEADNMARGLVHLARQMRPEAAL